MTHLVAKDVHILVHHRVVVRVHQLRRHHRVSRIDGVETETGMKRRTDIKDTGTMIRPNHESIIIVIEVANEAVVLVDPDAQNMNQRIKVTVSSFYQKTLVLIQLNTILNFP